MAAPLLEAMEMYASPSSVPLMAPGGGDGASTVVAGSMTAVTIVSVLSQACLLGMVISIVAHLGGGRFGGTGISPAGKSMELRSEK